MRLEWHRRLVLTLLWLVWATLAKHFAVTEHSDFGWRSVSHLFATAKTETANNAGVSFKTWTAPLPAKIDLKKKTPQICAFHTQARLPSPRVADGWVATRPSWLTAPEDQPPSQDVCSPQTSTTTGMKNTRSILHSSEELSINTMSQTRRNLFFTTMEASSEAQKCWCKQMTRSRAREAAHEAGAPAYWERGDASSCHSATQQFDLRSER